MTPKTNKQIIAEADYTCSTTPEANEYIANESRLSEREHCNKQIIQELKSNETKDSWNIVDQMNYLANEENYDKITVNELCKLVSEGLTELLNTLTKPTEEILLPLHLLNPNTDCICHITSKHCQINHSHIKSSEPNLHLEPEEAGAIVE